LAAWARRQLALGLAATDPQQAAKLLQSNASSKGMAVEDERALAWIQGQQASQRAAAIAVIEQSIKKKPLSPDEQFLLARLYERHGEHTKSRKLMLSLLAFHSDNAQYLAYQVGNLLQHGELDDARFYLALLERMEPATARTQQLRTALREAQMK